jgi:dUTP pyrophosphatase
MILNYKKLRKNAITPTRANPSDAGMDLYYCPNDLKWNPYNPSEKSTTELTIKIPNGQSALIPTGIAIEVPHGYMLLGLDKSGMASKKHLLLGGGVIDSGYAGELMVNLNNVAGNYFVGDTNYHVPPIGEISIAPGDKIAQIVLVPIVHFRLQETKGELYTDPLVISSRGTGGFGSTGK